AVKYQRDKKVKTRTDTQPGSGRSARLLWGLSGRTVSYMDGMRQQKMDVQLQLERGQEFLGPHSTKLWDDSSNLPPRALALLNHGLQDSGWDHRIITWGQRQEDGLSQEHG
ncbi:hypothetical protein P7K49_014871, partial [Saguinus oedipus]